MAYLPSNLCVLSYTNGFTFWHYRSSDPIDDIVDPAYFHGATALLRIGDFMFVNAGTGTGRFQHALLVVTDNRDGFVEVAPLCAPVRTGGR